MYIRSFTIELIYLTPLTNGLFSYIARSNIPNLENVVLGFISLESDVFPRTLLLPTSSD